MSDIFDIIKKKDSPKLVIIQARIPQDLKERLDKCLKDNEIKVSSVIRELIEEWLTDLKY